MRLLRLVSGLLLLFVIEILRVYWIMPFPGSQQSNTIGFAYFLNNNMLWLRIIGLVLALPPLIYFFRGRNPWAKGLLGLLVLFYAVLFYLFNFRFLADKMFYQPRQRSFAGAATDTTNKDRLVIGVAWRGEARAYPIGIIGYHHQVKDTLGSQPIMVTYCTVCRTGRVYSPIVDGRHLKFRLVGMDHFNAMFEDDETKSWWQQATGIAITGPMKGTRLVEIPSSQMRLGDWQALHPESLTLQPDPYFRTKYDSLGKYDEGIVHSSLEKRDSGSWKFKSWVIGVRLDGHYKAWDWNDLVKQRVICDSIGHSPVLITLLPNNKTFYALAVPDSLQLYYDPTIGLIVNRKNSSVWALDGNCLRGSQKGQSLAVLQAYQEFWHSWRTFHPGTEIH